MPASQVYKLRHLDRKAVALLLQERLPALIPYTRIVGRWLWIDGAPMPSPEQRRELRYLGFHWTHIYKCWRHPCGVYRWKRSANDPRNHYGQVPIDELIV